MEQARTELGRRAHENDESNASALLSGAVTTIGFSTLAVLCPHLVPLLALFASGREFTGVVNGDNLRKEIDGLTSTIDRVKRHVHRDQQLRPDEFRRFIEHPTTLKLLAEGRDNWAVDQMQPNLARLAAVVASRAGNPDADLSRDLRFARVAVGISDEGARLLAFMADREARGEFVGEEREGGAEKHPLRGETRLRPFLATLTLSTTQQVDAVLAATRWLEAEGLALKIEYDAYLSEVDALTCDDGKIARFRNEVWAPTSSGLAFVRLMRTAEMLDSSSTVVTGELAEDE